MMRARKKPVVIDFIEYTRDNSEKVHDFITNDSWNETDRSISISTLEGVMKAKIGDYIIKGVNGECYPCKPDIFEKTYEIINDESKETVEILTYGSDKVIKTIEVDEDQLIEE